MNRKALFPQLVLAIWCLVALPGTVCAFSQPQQTGQSKCYDSNGILTVCTDKGQDGELKAGIAWPNPRFLDNTDQTITDRLTGLIWTQDANTTGSAACSTTGSQITWQQALDHVTCLNANTHLGFTDWRLPNIGELRTLLHEGQPNTASWLSVLGMFTNVPTATTPLFWSSTSLASAPNAALMVRLGASEPDKVLKTATGYAWPVRGPIGVPPVQLSRTGLITCFDESGTPRTCTGSGEDGEYLAGVPWPSPRFLLNADQTVTDALTGLTWTQDANLMVSYDQLFDNDGVLNDGAVSWNRALQFIKTLNSANGGNGYQGYTDWRLPNLHEVLTLVDHGQATLATPLTSQGFSFGTTTPLSWWSSTTIPVTSNLNQAFSLQNADGSLFKTPKIANSWVWPVRGGSYGDAVITVSPMNISFGTITNGTSAATREIVLANTTAQRQDLIIDSITVEGTDAALFTVAPGGSNPCANLTPTIQPGGTCTLSAAFSSPSLGNKAATVRIQSNAVTGPVVATLSGTTVDGTPPTGSILINAGTLYTSSGNATLTIAASDDSGEQVQMRFSNDLSAWSAWALFDPNSPDVSWSLGGTDGLKTVYAQFRDNAGNISLTYFDTIILKATPPASVTVSGLPINGTTNSQTLMLTVAGSDVVEYQYSLATSADLSAATITPAMDTWVPISTQIRLNSLPEGSYLLTVSGRDVAQNVQIDPTILNWQIDRTVPTLTIDSVNSPTSVTNPIISGSVEVGISRVDVAIKPQSGATVSGTASVTGPVWSYPVPAPGLLTGTNLITVTAFDAAGNSLSATATVTFDNQPPAATIGGVPVAGTATSATTATLQVGGSEVIAYVYRLDGGSWSTERPVSTPIDLTNLASGIINTNGNWNHTVNVRGRDLAGNWQPESASTSYSWVVDTTPPAIVITPPTTPTISSTVILQGTLAETATVTVRNITTGASTQAQVNGLQWTLLTPMALAVGANQLTATAVDTAGNSTSISAIVEYDSSAPVAVIGTDITTGSTITRNSLTFTIGGTDVIAYQYQIVPATGFTPSPAVSTEQSVATAISLSPMPDATYTLSVRGIDAAGNLQPTPTTLTWTVDATAPALSFASGPANNSITSADSATFAVSTNTGVVAYKYALDTATYPTSEIDVNTAITLTGLTTGVHTIFAIGRDFIGNWQKIPTSITWTVDKLAPALAITPASNPTNVKSISGTAEPGAILTATIDGVAVTSPASVTVPANGAWTYALSTITDGIHTIVIKARDTAGNEATSTVLPNFDITVPIVTINGVGIPASPATTGATSAVFTVSANETLSAYTWKLDSGSMSAQVPATQPTQVAVATGTHTLTVEGYDAAGNKSLPRTLTWLVDTSQPTVVATLSGAPAGKSNATGATITVGGAGVNNYRYRWVAPTPGGVISTPAQTVNQPASTAINITTMPEGSYLLEVYGNDGAGTPVEQAYPTVIAWTVDRTGPTKIETRVSNVPASGYTNATTLNLAVSGTDLVAYRHKLVTIPGGAAATPAEDTDTLGGTPIAFSTTGNLFPEGSYTLAVIGKDTAGNWQVAPSGSWWTDPAVTTVTFIVDRTVPNTFTFNPVTGLTNANSQPLSGTAGDAASTVAVNIYRGATLVGTTTPVAGNWNYTVQGLAIGANSIRAEALDAAGNAVSISQTINLTTSLPTAVLQTSTIPPAVTTAQDASIVVTGANNVVAYRYRLDGGAYTPVAPAETPISTAITLAGLVEGPHTLDVIGKDIAGNWQESPTTTIWNIDRTAPVAVLNPTAPTTPINATRMVFDVNGTDVVAYKYSLDNAPYNTTERLVKLPIDLTALTTGSHTLRVIGRDLVGNWQLDANATVATWVVAIAPPQITVNPFITPTAMTTISLTGTVTPDAAATLTSFTIINSTTNTPVVATVTVNAWSAANLPLANGLNTITITATDSAGNITTKEVVIEMMGTAPTASILSGTPPVQTNATSLNLAIGGTGVVAYKYSLDGAAYGAESPVGTTLTLGPLTEGQHALRVIGRDEAGNWQTDPTNPTISWIIDITPPALTLTNLATPTSALSQTIRGSVEAGSAVTLAFDTGATGGSAIVIGTNWQFTTPNNALTGLKPGVNGLTITATDPAGNKTTLAAAIDYDASPPVATLTGTPTLVTRSTDVTLLVGGDGVVTYRYSLDNGGYSAAIPISSPIALTGLVDGLHTVAVLGRKLSGLEQATATTVSWTVDTTPPVAVISSGRPAAQTSQQDLAITVGGTGVILYRYSLDGEPYSPEAPIATPISRTGLLVGAHIINIIGRDDAGNWQVVPTQVSWTIDTTPPAGVLISGLPANPSNSTALNLTISGSDVAYYQYKLDSEAFSASFDVATPLLRTVPEGTHTIAIRGVDLAGNVQLVPTTFTWTIDSTPPVSTASPGGGEYDNTLDVTLTASEAATIYYTIDGSTPTINSSIYTTPLRIGKTTTIRFFARDLAGNLEGVHDETYTFIANGDIDGDGRLTLLDAIKAMRFAAKIETPTTEEFKRADVAPLANYRPNPDNQVNIQDVVVIMKLIVKILSW